MGTYKCCIFFPRRFTLPNATTPEDVSMLFSRFSGGTHYMGVDELRRYLVATGDIDGDDGMTVAERIVDRVLHGRSHTPRCWKPALTVDDFYNFLFSENLNPPIRQSKVVINTSAHVTQWDCPVIKGNKWSSTKWLHVGEYKA
ncbi:hypothetical protein ZWY2020_035880 [Hordeum vulgare]|nr:hypothetical protein ZWY2020_035880 [Hordeum vulgare]